MEMRDVCTPDDPDWLDWQAGHRFGPEERWASWSGLIRAAVARGVGVRRIRLVSGPVTGYIGFEYDVTAAHNLGAGEQVRWLPRRAAAGLLVPCSDFWVLDDRVVLWNHFAGDGSWVAGERCDDAAVARCRGSSMPGRHRQPVTSASPGRAAAGGCRP